MKIRDSLTNIERNTHNKNGMYSPNEGDKVILDNYVARVEEYHNATIPIRKLWKRIDDAYELEPAAPADVWSSNYYLPKLYQAGENLTSSISQFDLDFIAMPTDPGQVDHAKSIEKILGQKMEEMLFREKIKLINRQRVYYGTSIVKLGWRIDYETGPMKTLQKSLSKSNLLQNLGFNTKKLSPQQQIKIMADTIFCDVLDLKDVYFSPFYGSIDNLPEIIFSYPMTLENIKNTPIFKKYGNVDYVYPGETFAGSAHGAQYKSRVNNVDMSQAFIGTEKVTVFEIQTKTEICWVANCSGNDVMLARKPNPYNMLTAVVAPYKRHLNPNMIYGVSDIMKSLDLEDAQMDLFKQAMDNVRLINNPMFVYNKSADINPEDLISRPGGGIAVSDIERDIKELSRTDLKSSIFGAIDVMDTEIQQTTNVSSLSKGLSGGGNSASETRLQQQNRLTVLEDVMGETVLFMESLGRKTLKMTSKMQDGKDIPIKVWNTQTGEYELNTVPKDILKVNHYDLRVRVKQKPPMDPAALLQQVMQSTNMFLQQGTVNKSEAHRLILDLQGLGGYADKIVLDNADSMNAVPEMTLPPEEGGEGGGGVIPGYPAMMAAKGGTTGSTSGAADGNAGQMPLDGAIANDQNLVRGIEDASGGKSNY